MPFLPSYIYQNPVEEKKHLSTIISGEQNTLCRTSHQDFVSASNSGASPDLFHEAQCQEAAGKKSDLEEENCDHPVGEWLICLLCSQLTVSPGRSGTGEVLSARSPCARLLKRGPSAAEP